MRKTNEFEIQENCLTCSWRQKKRFCGLSPEGLGHLQRIALLGMHQAGAVLYREGQIPNGVFILCNGGAKISISSSRGSVVILKMAEPGEMLGLEAVLGDRPHEETAELMDSCQVKFVGKQELLGYFASHGEAAVKAALQLNTNCQSARKQIRHMGFSVSGGEKLARLLFTWVNDGRNGHRHEKILSTSFTHEEIAQMVGSTRETITRALNHLKRKEVLEVRGKTLIVKNVEELERLANE
jgi:CRP/FNR family transcriptional regulator, cyclic AMP receptor protein